MKYKKIHEFIPDIPFMKNIQLHLKEKLSFNKLSTVPKIISGVDLSISGDYAISVIVTMDYKTLKLLDITSAKDKIELEYIPGYLAFRELPVFLKAWELLKIDPDLVFFDGHGYAHPRRLGIASHASFFIEKPTVGIGKSLLVGKFIPPAPEKGSISNLVHNNEIIGAVLRTKDKVNPVFVSPGNFITLEESIKFTLDLTTKYRIPEITRIADLYSKKLKKEP